MSRFTESAIEQAAYAWRESNYWPVHQGAEIAPGDLRAGLGAYGQILLAQRMRDALLPKLISGELRMKDTERLLKDRVL